MTEPSGDSINSATGPPDGGVERDRAVEAVVADFVERLRVGLNPDLDTFLMDYPDLASDLDIRLRAALALHRATTPMPIPPTKDWPDNVGRFEIRGFLGGGATGRVYQAYDPRGECEVAVKVLSANPAAAGRFTRETRLLAKLRHTHIVPFREAGEADGVRYLVFDLVVGESLEQRLARGAWPDDRTAVTWVMQLDAALGYAHRHGMVHRDVKPANILLPDDGEPLLTDFGLARDVTDHTLTKAGEVLGTAAYMAPEQARGDAHAADVRADIYSLGVILYRLLTRQLPYGGCRTPSEFAYRHAQGPPLPPRSVRPDLPCDLDLICRRAIELNPDDRFATADVFAAELGRWLGGESLTIRPPGPAVRFTRWFRGQSRLARGLILAAVATATVTPFLVWAGWNLHVTARLAEDKVRLEREVRARQEAIVIVNRARQRYESPIAGHRDATADDVKALLACRADVAEADFGDRVMLEARSLVASSLMEPDVTIRMTAKLALSGATAWYADVHPTGAWGAVGTLDGPVRFEPGKEVTVPKSWEQSLERPRVRFSPDGRYLFSLAELGGLVVWTGDVTRRLATPLNSPTARVLDLGFRADGGAVFAALADGTVRGWTLPEYLDVQGRFVDLPPGPWTAARFDSGATRLAVADPTGTVTVIPAGTSSIRRVLSAGDTVTAMAWAPAGHPLAVATQDGDVTLRDTDGKDIRRLQDFLYGARQMEFHRDGELLFAGNHADGLRVWDVVTGVRVLADVKLIPSGFAADGVTFAAATTDGVALCRFEPAVAVRRLAAPVKPLINTWWAADAPVLAGIDTAFGVTVWNLDTRRVADAFAGPKGGFYPHNAVLALSPDGTRLTYASGGDRESRLLLRDVVRGQTLQNVSLLPGFDKLAAPANGHFRLVREEFVDGTQVLRSVAYDVFPDRPPERLGVVRPPDPADVRRFFESTLSPDGTRYLWAGPRKPHEAGRIEVREVPSGKEVWKKAYPERKPGSELFTALHPDGRNVWVAVNSYGVHRIDMTGQEPAVSVQEIPSSFSPDGSVLKPTSAGLIRSVSEVSLVPAGRADAVLLFRPPVEKGLVQLSPNGRFLSMVYSAKTLSVLDLPAIREAVDRWFATRSQ